MGFAINCVLIPGLYAGLAYWYSGQVPKLKSWSLEIAILVSFPLVASGIRDWWDIWVLPFPKLGSQWPPLSPKDYLIKTLRWHSVSFAGCLVLHLWANQSIAAKKFAPSTLDVPYTQKWVEEQNEDLAKAKAKLEEDKADKRNERESRTLLEMKWEKAQERIDEMTWKRDATIKKLADHEKQEEFLRSHKEEAPDEYVPSVVYYLWVAAFGTAVVDPIKKKFDSGQPIERA